MTIVLKLLTVLFLVAGALAASGCAESGDPADIVGVWTLDDRSIDNAAYNNVRTVSDRAGRNLTDAEIDPVARELAVKMRAEPATFVFESDGTFHTGGEGDTMVIDGTWTYRGEILTIESSAARKPVRFRFEPGSLVNEKAVPPLRTIKLIRKT